MIKKIIAALTVSFGMVALTPLSAIAANTVVVTPSNTQGWAPAVQQTGATYSFVADAASPMPEGALQLTTTADNNSKVQYMHSSNTPLSTVNTLKYSTKQVSGPAEADPSYQIATCLGGVANGQCAGFTTLVYEPYSNGSVTPNLWQSWDVMAGNLWSSSSYTAGTCVVAKAPGGPPTYKISDIKTNCPDAIVVAYGVNVGTYNQNYVVRTDEFNFNGTTYNFEQTNVPDNKDNCKNDGFKNYTDKSGASFKNQGQCVSFVASNDHSGNKPASNNTGGLLNSIKSFFSNHL